MVIARSIASPRVSLAQSFKQDYVSSMNELDGVLPRELAPALSRVSLMLGAP